MTQMTHFSREILLSSPAIGRMPSQSRKSDQMQFIVLKISVEKNKIKILAPKFLEHPWPRPMKNLST